MSAPARPRTGELAAEAWERLRTVVLDNERRREACAAVGLSFGRVRALCALAGGARTMGELASALGTDAPYTSVLVQDLERRALVTRSTHAADRRVRLVELSASGRDAACRASAVLERPPAALGELAPADLELLVGLLRRLARTAPPTA